MLLRSTCRRQTGSVRNSRIRCRLHPLFGNPGSTGVARPIAIIGFFSTIESKLFAIVFIDASPAVELPREVLNSKSGAPEHSGYSYSNAAMMQLFRLNAHLRRSLRLPQPIDYGGPALSARIARGHARLNTSPH